MTTTNGCWVFSVTYFALLSQQKDLFKFFNIICKKFVYQYEECPTTKNRHFQCYINLKVKKRKDQLFKMFNAMGFPGATCLPASDKGKQILKLYCMKENTRIAGPWADHPIYLGRDLIRVLRPWQKKIVDMLDEIPHDRRIWWYKDKKGGIGKSSLAKYLCYHHKIIPMKCARQADLINLVFKFPSQKMYIFDVQRTTRKDMFLDMITTIEEVKTGLVINTKYETGVKMFDRPHIIVFSNYDPPVEKLSNDMIKVVDLATL